MLQRMLRNPRTYISLIVTSVLAILLVFSDLGAGVNPKGNTHNLPLVIANEDAGAQLNGQQVKLSDQIVAMVTAPNPQQGDAVKWTVVHSRQDAINLMLDNKAYGGLAIPSDFTAKLSALSSQGGPPAGAAPAGGAPGGAAAGGAPAGGAPAGAAPASGPPAGAAAGNGAPAGGAAQGAGPTAASIEILTNPAAGIVAESAAEAILDQIAAGISKGASGQALDAINKAGARIPGSVAVVVANPVVATTTAAVPIGDHSGLGLTPFYVSLMVVLVGFLGTIVVSQGTDMLVLRMGYALSKLEMWELNQGLVLVFAVLAGFLQTLAAVGVLGMDAPNSVTLALLIMLGTAVMGSVTLLFVTLLGEIGLLPASFVVLAYGPPASGGIIPPQMLPGFYRFLAAWLPVRFLVDAVRSSLFLHSRLSAGLGTALWVLFIYLLLMIALGGAAAVSLGRRRSRSAATQPAAVLP